MIVVNRIVPNAPPSLALTASEVMLFDRLADRPRDTALRRTLSTYLHHIARHGGLLAHL
ncbi:hypothetical protein [Sphingomonas sp. CCH5-D11]|jgi:hypothetical protein|uniref:hypothetical protein n=1 Tax=Sphingomonas sp. CCH5-D11 TaxID=1768786 RepID=UPI000AD288CA|nr:hypothetical protein [Sphingomonas sp. CCH5-D11]